MNTVAVALPTRSPVKLLVGLAPIIVLLLAYPWIATQYQAMLLGYGLVMAIAALGFNLLLGYTGLLSFGHSAFFGVGAYAVALVVKYFRVSSMELFLLSAVVSSIFPALKTAAVVPLSVMAMRVKPST